MRWRTLSLYKNALSVACYDWLGPGKHVIMTGALVLLFTILCAGASAQEEERTIITIGQPAFARHPNFVISSFCEIHPSVTLIEEPMPRDWERMYRTALPKTLPQLPDIVILYVGTNSGDLVDLVDRDLIEPLDGLLEEAGVTPDAFFPNTIKAVKYKKKIWALPNVMIASCLAYNKRIFSRLEIEPRFESWQQLFEAAERISTSQLDGQSLIGFARRPDQALWLGMYIADLPQDRSLSIKNPSAIRSQDMLKAYSLLYQHEATGTIRVIEEFDAVSRGDVGIAISHNVFAVSNETLGLLDTPKRIFRDDPRRERGGAPGSVQCYALKKNTHSKLRAGSDFLKWLLAKDTQLKLVKASGLALPLNARPTWWGHIPLLKPIIESPEFQEIMSKQEDYAILLREMQTAWFSRQPGELGSETAMLANEIISTDLVTHGARDTLVRAHEALENLITTTPTRSGEFDEY